MAPVVEVDARIVNGASVGPVTARIRETYHAVLRGEDELCGKLVTPLT